MIYLDNSASTFYKPFCVKWVVIKSLFCMTANPGRSGHRASQKSGDAVFNTREILAKTFNTNADRVVFTSGCTEALNLAIRGSVRKGGHIITSCYEHNAVLRTLEHLQAKGYVTYSVVVPARKDGVITEDELSKALTKDTYMLIINHISNVLGIKQDIKRLGFWARRNNLLFVVDGAQSAGHESIDMKDCEINMLAIAGHKALYGIQGVGALLLDDNVYLNPIKFGGTGTNSEELRQPASIPEGLESGTLPTPAIVSLGAGCKYAYSHLIEHTTIISDLSRYLLDGLKQVEGVIIYTPDTMLNGVIAFNVVGWSSGELANQLNEYGFAVRSGLQCAPLAHKYMGTLNQGGAVRVSISHKNTKQQLRKFLKVIEVIAR